MWLVTVSYIMSLILGFAFVEFATQDLLEQACIMHHIMIDGKQVCILICIFILYIFQIILFSELFNFLHTLHICVGGG